MTDVDPQMGRMQLLRKSLEPHRIPFVLTELLQESYFHFRMWCLIKISQNTLVSTLMFGSLTGISLVATSSMCELCLEGFLFRKISNFSMQHGWPKFEDVEDTIASIL